MAADLRQQLERVASKARIVSEKYQVLRAEKAAADSEIEQLRAQLLSRDTLIERMRVEAEYLRVATTLVPDRDSLQQTRAIISDLVREIDRVIADLND